MDGMGNSEKSNTQILFDVQATLNFTNEIQCQEIILTQDRR